MISSQVEDNPAAIPIVMRDSFFHCQNAGTRRLVWSIHNLNGVIGGECHQIFLTTIVPAPPQEFFRNGHISHPLNTTGCSAVKEESVVGRYIREISDIGSETDGQGWNCRVRKVLQLCINASKLVNASI